MRGDIIRRDYARALRYDSAEVPEEMEIAGFIEHLHWDYQQYENAPTWLLAALRIKIDEDNLYRQEKEARK